MGMKRLDLLYETQSIEQGLVSQWVWLFESQSTCVVAMFTTCYIMGWDESHFRSVSLPAVTAGGSGMFPRRHHRPSSRAISECGRCVGLSARTGLSGSHFDAHHWPLASRGYWWPMEVTSQGNGTEWPLLTTRPYGHSQSGDTCQLPKCGPVLLPALFQFRFRQLRQ